MDLQAFFRFNFRYQGEDRMRMKLLVVTAAASVALTACQPAANTGNNAASNANANANAAKPAAAAPTKDALMALEKSAYEAWKSKDAKFWETFLTNNFVGYGATGKLDKASASKEYAGTDCDIKSYSLSDEQMTPLGSDAALVTHKSTIDGTCGGQKVPANSWTASIYVRDGDKWKGAFHADSPIPDPNAPAPKPASSSAKPAPPPAANAEAAKPDTATDAMFALEKKAWEDWMKKNAAGLESWASKDLVAFTSKGRQSRADAIKTWMEDGCEVKAVPLSDPSSMSLGPDFALFNFKATPDAKCQGSQIPAEYGSTIYAKEGGAWKALFTMGSPMN
jgi:hypothetical protein